MITPIIMPIHSSEPDKCPNCGKEEDIKQVCKHCNYEYTEDDDSPSAAFFLIGAVITWAFITIIWWLIDNGAGGKDRTLVEIIVSQIDFITSLKIW